MAFFAAAAIVCAAPSAIAEGNELNVSWSRAGDDLDMARVVMWPDSAFSPELVLLRTNLVRYRVGVVKAEDYGAIHDNVKKLSKQSKAVIGINANFFDEKGKALGLVVNRAVMRQRVHAGGNVLTGVFQVDRNGISIINRSDFKPESTLEAVQAGPRLIVNGQRVHGLSETTSYSRRAGLCVDQKGRLILYISSGLIGITIEQVQDVLLDKQIRCTDALNLDGGSSAQLFVSKEILGTANGVEDISVEGSSNVPVMLGLFLK